MARKQVIVYSLTTGRVRQVLDCDDDRDDASMSALMPPRAGEGSTLYMKRGIGPDGKPQDTLHAWQAHVATITGKLPHPVHPETEAAVLAARPDAVRQPSDLHWVIDSAGATIGTVHADPGEEMPGYTLRPAPDLQI